MSTQELTPIHRVIEASDVEKILISGDLGKLSPDQRLSYYRKMCESLGLNPLTKPFAYLNLNGKLVLYALKDCTEQLRTIHAISLTIPAREAIEGVYVVTARATRADGRCDEATGAVAIEGLKGESRANAMMKAETKAKRRVTLSICGLGMLDETEVETIPGAERIDTGGAPIGTAEAAQNVAQRRIEEETAKTAPFDKFKMLKLFSAKKADLKKLLGSDDMYYQILHESGLEHANEITTRKKGIEVLDKLKKAFDAEMAAATSK